MTNEEKAKEISNICKNCLTDGINGCSECEKAGKYLGALEMAEWKDKQFKEFKNLVKEFFLNCDMKHFFKDMFWPIELQEEIEKYL